MEDNDLQATSTTTCRTLPGMHIKFENSADILAAATDLEKANNATATALNFRFLQLQAPSLESVTSKAFKMEPDTTLSDFVSSQIPPNLLPLSPIQQSTTVGFPLTNENDRNFSGFRDIPMEFM